MKSTSPVSSTNSLRQSSLVSRLIEKWNRRTPFDARAAMAEYSELPDDGGMLIDLAYEEYCQRKEAGELIADEAFLERFPEIRSGLMRLLEVHHLLENQPDLKGGVTDGIWPAAGSLFAGIEIMEEIGRGGMSRVYLARELTLGKRLIVAKLTRFPQEEANALGRLNHAGIVPALSVVKDPLSELTAICMPYYGRTTLHDVLNAAYRSDNYPTSWDSVVAAVGHADSNIDESAASRTASPRSLGYVEGIVSIGVQVAEALDFAHQRGFVHCDIKPSNILLRGRLTPMLLDFNLARSRESAVLSIGGTLPYMAPEIVWEFGKDSSVETRHDVYSLAVTLYQMLTGQLPYGGDSNCGSFLEAARLLRSRQSQGQLASWDRLTANVPSELSELLKRCLSADSKDRPATAAEFANSLRDTQRRRVRLKAWVRHHPWPVATQLSALVMLMGLVAWWFVTRPPYVDREFVGGRNHLLEARFAQAATKFGNVLAVEPDRLDAQFLRGASRLRSGEYDLAFRDLTDVHRKIPSPIIDAELGYWVCLASRRYDQAVVHFERAYEHGADTVDVHNNIGYCLYRLLTFGKARQHLQRALQMDPASPVVKLNLAWLEYREALAEKRPPDLSLFAATSPEAMTSELEALAACATAAAAKYGGVSFEDAEKALQKALSSGVMPERLYEVVELVPALRNAPGLQQISSVRGAETERPGHDRLLDPMCGWRSRIRLDCLAFN